MTPSADFFSSLASTCAPQVSPATLIAIAEVESRLEPLTIRVNGPAPVVLRPRTRAEASELASHLLRQGRNLDLGLLQINSRNLARLRLTADDAFDICRNLASGARILADAYAAERTRQAPQAALRTALSLYNTGDRARGFRNGYVARVIEAATPSLAPRLADGTPTRRPTDAPVTADAAAAPPSSLDVFAAQPSDLSVWRRPPGPTAPASATPSVPLQGDLP